MSQPPIDVLGSGTVVLGKRISCDGFHRDSAIRVQSHIHDDHMGDFSTSKGFQDVVLSEGTQALLVAEYDAEISARANGGNFYPLAPGEAHRHDGCAIYLLPNFHMLGSVQTAVETSSGARLGYSGDFAWPIDEAFQMRCDALVVDATYGSPENVRQYTQGEAEAAFVEQAIAKLRCGPLHIKAHRGTIQRALQLLSGEVDSPIISSDRLCREIGVYQQFGLAAGTVFAERSPDGRLALKNGRFIKLYSKGDQFPCEVVSGSTIVLSAFMTSPDSPVLEYSPRACRVALSNHADFIGTLEYIEATGAKYVVTDNTRGGHAIRLAVAINERLGIDARPSSNTLSLEWGCG